MEFRWLFVGCTSLHLKDLLTVASIHWFSCDFRAPAKNKIGGTIGALNGLFVDVGASVQHKTGVPLETTDENIFLPS